MSHGFLANYVDITKFNTYDYSKQPMIRKGVHKIIYSVHAAIRLSPRPAHCNLDAISFNLVTL